jgi:hypothetical protein
MGVIPSGPNERLVTRRDLNSAVFI